MATRKKVTPRKKTKTASPKKKGSSTRKVTAKKAERKEVKSLKNETWKKIKKNGSTKRMNYMISSNGRIKSVDKKTKDECLIKGTYTKGGYHQFNIKISDDKRKTFYVHRLVAELFLDKPKKSQEFVCHKNGKKADNKMKNLMWADRKQWSKLHDKLGTYQNLDRRGGYNSKLTEAKVKAIKKSLKAGRKTKTSIAEKYSVSITQINRIASGENWGHVKI